MSVPVNCGSNTLDANGKCTVCGYQVNLALMLAVSPKGKKRS